jgi:hypothetical protein
MSGTKNLYGPFRWGVLADSCDLRVTSFGRKLPVPLQLSETTKNTIVFWLDKSYGDELVEISLANFAGVSAHCDDEVCIVCTRETNLCHNNTKSSVFKRRCQEHHIMTICLQGNECMHIEYHCSGKSPILMMVLQFVLSDKISK